MDPVSRDFTVHINIFDHWHQRKSWTDRHVSHGQLTAIAVKFQWRELRERTTKHLLCVRVDHVEVLIYSFCWEGQQDIRLHYTNCLPFLSLEAGCYANGSRSPAQIIRQVHPARCNKPISSILNQADNDISVI